MFNHNEKNLRKSVLDALHWATKIRNYRCDILTADQNKTILNYQNLLSNLNKTWAKSTPPPEGIQEALNQLQKYLKSLKTPFFPVSFWSDNAEVLWVAAFLALSIRTFFIQPFRIPTCSMFPSFSGMLTQVQSDKKTPPSFIIKPFRWLLKGAENYHYKAPNNGFIKIPLFNQQDMVKYNSHIRYEIEYGREIGPFWFKHFLPKPYKVYILWVGHEQIRIRMPYEFTDMEALLRKKFFPQYESFTSVLQSPYLDLNYSSEKGYYINTSTYAQKGKCCLHFDILCGDMVFVDRLTYHFRRPRNGEAIVFRTKKIPRLNSDLYYIKRLAGQAGDQLKIQNNRLYCNGQLATGSSAFENNNQKLGIYPGYRADGCLKFGTTTTVSKNHFFALGDNSPFSYDSRFWGEVPEKEVLGKAAFVLHPISWRWGFAEHPKANLSANPQDYVFK